MFVGDFSEQKWGMEYLCNNSGKSPVEEWLDSLSNEQLKSVAKEIKLLELCGNKLKLPHSRSLKNGLFELRERKYGYRIYYAFMPNAKIILLHTGGKSSQERDIKKSRDLLDELIRTGEQ